LLFLKTRSDRRDFSLSLSPSPGADDLALVERLSNGKVDLTYGSALDIFGGSQVKFDDLVAYNKRASSLASS
jgi:vacuolar-type H+-ATPase subunit E/Vma4